MTTRPSKQYSDRGSLKDLAAGDIPAGPAEDIEIKLKNLYEYAEKNNDQDLLRSLGFITTDYISDKNALPLSVYKLRKIVADISSRPGSQVAEFKLAFDEYFSAIETVQFKEYLEKKASKNFIKTASYKYCDRGCFWRKVR